MFFVVKLFVCSIDTETILCYHLFNKVFPVVPYPAAEAVGLYYHASSWTTYGNNSCGHGGTGPDLLQRGTCTLRCFYDDTNFTSTERSVYCTNTGIRYD